jgi:hypothetical protein
MPLWPVRFDVTHGRGGGAAHREDIDAKRVVIWDADDWV